MAQFYDGGLDAFNAMIHADPHPNTVRFLENMVERPSMAISAASQAFMGQARDMYERYTGSDAMRRIRAAGRQLGNQWNRNEIRPLETIAALQTAPIKMHRWLMAEPNIRKLYHKQQCDGYSESYVDSQPGYVGEDHYDYRRVMDGIVVETDDSWVSTEYIEELEEQDSDFLFDEQFDILRSWSTMAAAVMKKEDDPTSKWNDGL